MKGRKDEEKMMGPLFPRLHINDTEKGGPRAPPRNKMALYEQFSIPSQRCSSGLSPMLPLPPNNGSSLVYSTSSSHGGGQERNVFTPFCNPPAPTNFQALNGTGHFSSTAKCNLFQPHKFSNFTNPSMKKPGDGDDFRIPTFSQSEITPHFPHLSLNSSIQLQTAYKKQMKGTGTTDLKSRQHVGNQSEGNPKVSHSSEDPTQWPASIPSTGDKILADAYPSPSTRDKNSESFKQAHASSNQESRSSFVDDISRLYGTNARSHQECVALREKMPLKNGVLVERVKGIGMGNASKVRDESYSNPSLGHDHRSPNGLENGSECPVGKECVSLQEEDVNRNDDVSDTVDSILALDISPDDVVGVIGEKQFWKARRDIAKKIN